MDRATSYISPGLSMQPRPYVPAATDAVRMWLIPDMNERRVMEAEAPVYVVDDDELVRRSLQRLLGSAGYRVHSFASATNFLESVEGLEPGCLVLDLRLPDMDGSELHRQLQASGFDLPVVFLTGFGDIPTSVRAIKSGAIDFLQKPVSDTALLDAIAGAISRAREEHDERARLREFARRYATLTPREREVLQLVLAGKLNKQIAQHLAISEKTVKVHRAHLMSKMGVRRIAVLAQIAAQMGWTRGIGTDSPGIYAPSQPGHAVPLPPISPTQWIRGPWPGKDLPH
jgi:RNA polymerase sigma factor (sigma-70 family)